MVAVSVAMPAGVLPDFWQRVRRGGAADPEGGERGERVSLYVWANLGEPRLRCIDPDRCET